MQEERRSRSLAATGGTLHQPHLTEGDKGQPYRAAIYMILSLCHEVTGPFMIGLFLSRRLSDSQDISCICTTYLSWIRICIFLGFRHRLICISLGCHGYYETISE